MPDDSEVLLISDAIATLILCENKIWHSIGEINILKFDRQPVSYINLDMLLEDTVTASYHLLGLQPATLDDSLSGTYDWRTYQMNEKSFTVSGKLI